MTLTAVIAGLTTLVAVAFTCFQLYTSGFGTLATLQQNYIHLGFALVLVFLTRPAFSAESRFSGLRWAIDAPFIIGAVAITWYPVAEFLDIADRGAGDPTQIGVILGVVCTILVIDGTRRVVGLALPILAVLALAYAFAGPYLPGLLAHRGFDIERVASTLYLTTAGIAGTPLQVSATFVAIFVIFAAFLDVSGAGKFFIDWSYAALGWMRGGPAKVAILASALMGTVSGSAVANTAATGSFTIPIMKKNGLRPPFAGAVEAAASSGGQIMPPVMGAAALIMPEIMGVPYKEIVTAAILPGILYFAGVFAMVDFEVAKMGVRGVPRAQLPDARKIFKDGWHLLIPLVVLVFLLFVMEFTPTMSGFYSVVAVVLASWLRRATRLTPRRFWGGLERGGRALLEVAMACACAGIVIGVLMLTGLALRLTSILIDAAGGQIFPLLMITMSVSILLGMGLPTSAVYVILAILVAPALVKMGVTLMAAHMFVFYFGVLANVTPPVAIAAYTGAGIAGADPTRTGFIAFRIALAGFILPFIWVYNPALLLDGAWHEVLSVIATAFLGILGLASASQGYLFGPKARIHERLLIGVGAISLIVPDLMTDLGGLALFVLAIGSRFLLRRGKSRAATEGSVRGE